jgi:hypothetical protein
MSYFTEIKLVDKLTGVAAGVDSASSTLRVVDYEHAAVHSGAHFTIAGYDESLGMDETVELVITTPDTTVWAHLNLSVSAGYKTVVDVYEGSSGLTGGSTITPINNDRNSLTESDMVVTKDPTAITDGTLLMGFVTSLSQNMGLMQRPHEIILKQDTTYLIRITGREAGNPVSWHLNWYELVNGS